MNKKQRNTLEIEISAASAHRFTIDHCVSVGGGSINQAWQVSDKTGKTWFVKLNNPKQTDMFAAEADGLAEMAKTKAIRVPEPLCYGETEDMSYIVMEYIPLQSRQNNPLLGQKLAAMHGYQSDEFGWWRDNTIGSTPQSNRQYKHWVNFWKNERLGFQLDLAHSRGYSSKAWEQGQRLNENIGVFFSDYQPSASLLHGDLWGGNCAADAEGNPVIFDPAVYYGDREADLAMTELFGGFGHDFLTAYHESYPIDAGYKTRKTLYNLYHILNHYNLFGSGYGSQAASMTERLLAEI